MLIKCPECGREISDQATSCPGCGCPQSLWATKTYAGEIASAPSPLPTDERTALEPVFTELPNTPEQKTEKPLPSNDNSGAWGLLVAFGVVVFCSILALIIFGIEAETSAKKQTQENAQATATQQQTLWIPTPSPTPSVAQFGEDAEAIVDWIKGSLGSSYKYSWYAGDYKLSLTVKVPGLSGDDLAGLFAVDPTGTQQTIDSICSSMRGVNASAWRSLKDMGYQDCTVEFSILTSDDLTIAKCSNGTTTESVSADNFRYG